MQCWNPEYTNIKTNKTNIEIPNGFNLFKLNSFTAIYTHNPHNVDLTMQDR